MKLYGIGDFSKLIGVTQQTLRIWDKDKRLSPSLGRARLPMKYKKSS
ncbi:MerR family transcriptional regulator [Paenibacillus sp. 32O-W]